MPTINEIANMAFGGLSDAAVLWLAVAGIHAAFWAGVLLA